MSAPPHLLRHLNELNEKYKNVTWGTDFQNLLYKALQINNKYTQKDKVFSIKTMEILQQLKNLLAETPEKKRKELYTFYKRMCRERQNLLTFLFIKNVVQDNNASERAIKKIKVKQKISGQFKTEKAAQNFDKIRSVIDTTIKNGQSVLQALELIAKLQPKAIN